MSGIHSHDHHHHPDFSSHKALWWAFWINVAFLVIEFVGGLMTGSLALLSDAGHMLSDVGALGLAVIASRIAARGPSSRHTYGYGRAEVLAALINGLALWLIVGAVFVEAFKRLMHPQEVESLPMLIVAAIGLLANIAGAVILFRHRDRDLNVRGAFLHLAADSLSSVGVVIAGLLMWQFGWYIADPLASFLIGLLILGSSWQLVKDSIHALMEGIPRHLDIDEVQNRLEELDGVRDCHDLHIWTISSGEPILTAHLAVDPDTDRCRVLRDAMRLTREELKIDHVTLQVEKEDLHGPLH
jgi:cobalt-zinc-cadmium efflux system protein